MPEKPSKNPNLKHTSHFSFAEKQKLWGKYRNQNSGINHQEKKESLSIKCFYEDAQPRVQQRTGFNLLYFYKMHAQENNLWGIKCK